MDSKFLQNLFNSISLSKSPSEWLASDDGLKATKRRLQFLAKEYGDSELVRHLNTSKSVQVATKNDALAKALVAKADLLLAQNEEAEETLRLLTQALMFAEDKGLQRHIYATRAALSVEQRLFKAAILDLDRCLQINQPDLKSHCNLLKTRAQTFMEIAEWKAALDDWQALLQLQQGGGGRARAQREQAMRQLKLCKCNMDKEKLNTENEDNELVSNEEKEKGVGSLFEAHSQLPNLSCALEVCYELGRGRYCRARRFIRRGEMIACDKAFVLSLDASQSRSRCWYCTKQCNTPIPCDHCSAVLFCDSFCKDAANVYHGFECGITALLQTSSLGAWILAYRAVISRPKSFFLSGKSAFLSSNGQYGTATTSLATSKRMDDTHDGGFQYGGLEAFHNLVSHDSSRSKEAAELMMQCLTTLFLVRCLEHKQYLASCNWKQGLSEEHLFFALLIHHFMRVAFYNTHELTDAHIDELAVNIDRIGRGTHPTLALFNHGCDPNYRRIGLGNRTLGVAIRDIEEGEEVVDCYTNTFNACNKEERQRALNKYNFECNCRACSQNWPVLSQLPRHLDNKADKKRIEALEKKIQKCRGQRIVNREHLQTLIQLQIELCDVIEKSVKRPHHKIVVAEHELFNLMVRLHATK